MVGAVMNRANLLGTGSAVPDEVISNDELARRWSIDTDDAWIQRRTGIRERRFAPAGVGPADLGARAAHAALADAGIEADALDLIVFATLSPERCFPGSGVLLQRLLGLPDRGRTVPCLDVRNQCSGFLYALSHATAMIRAGMARHVLVVGAEVHSAALDLSTRGRAVASLFGDGAGAVVLGPGDAPGVRHVLLHADGRGAEALMQGVWDTRRRPFITLDEAGNGVIPPEALWAHMDGPAVFRAAVTHMVEVLRELAQVSGVPLGDIDTFCLHQANARINEAVRQALDLPEDRCLNNIARYGNTTAATIPLLLDEARRAGRLGPGRRTAMAAFGSGYTWGAALLET